MRESDDYWAFAQGIYEAAQRGDGAARYYLGLALNKCRSDYPALFIELLGGNRVRHRTLDEARQFVKSLQIPPTEYGDLRLLQSRCGRLMRATEPPFGNGDDWLAAAAAVGYAPAQVDVAVNKTMRSLEDPGSEETRLAQSEARKLVAAALRDEKPDAERLIRLGDLAAMLVLEDVDEARKRRYSWMIAACLRTPNCDGLAEWAKQYCEEKHQCQPHETPADLLRRDAGDVFDEAERRARDLNEKIDAGILEESDI